MKLAKRTLALVLAVMMVAAVMVVPASAASSSTNSKISCFPYLYHGVVNSDGVKALQKFLLTDTNNANYTAIYNDGLDGGFGPNLESAVRSYQVRHGIYGSSNNGTGEVYTQTWTAIANDVNVTESGGIIKSNDVNVYKVVKSGSIYSFYYNNSVGSTSWSTNYFARG